MKLLLAIFCCDLAPMIRVIERETIVKEVLALVIKIVRFGVR